MTGDWCRPKGIKIPLPPQPPLVKNNIKLGHLKNYHSY